MSDALPATIWDVPTPAFLVDIDKVKSNATAMIQRCKDFGVTLRPHMKTHKTIEGGEILTGGTKKKIVVSTLAEASFYADNGFDDILYAVVLTADKVQRCKTLTNQLSEFHVLIDSIYGLQCIQDVALDDGKIWSVFLKVDCGYGRAGALWDSDDGIEVGKAISSAKNVGLMGIYTHCGNSYGSTDPNGIRKASGDAADKLCAFAKRLKDAGVDCPVIATGSTPSCTQPSEKMTNVTEFHPGNYIFYDYMQTMIGSVGYKDVACRVATRIINHKPSLNQFLVDCGFLGISHDGISKNLPEGFCVFQDNPNLRMTNMSQEVGKVHPAEGKMDYSKYPLGSMLFIYPFHSCATAAMHPVYYIHSGEKIVGTWKPIRGW